MNKFSFVMLSIWIFVGFIACTPQLKSPKSPEARNHPTRENQAFYTAFPPHDTLHVAYFIGEKGAGYSTYEEAMENKGEGRLIVIINKEYGGGSAWNQSILLDSEEIPKEKWYPVHPNYQINQRAIKSIYGSFVSCDMEATKSQLLHPEDLDETKFLEMVERLREIGIATWKLQMKRQDKDVVAYDLFGKRARYYGEPENAPFVQISMTIDNSISADKINSIIIRLGYDIDVQKFQLAGYQPKNIKE